MDDLEDLTPPLPSTTRSILPSTTIVPNTQIKYSTSKPSPSALSSTHATPSLLDNLNIPGTQSVWLKTFGCAHNVSDSEYMAGLLNSYGYTLTDDRER